jgi:hypothetical protein
MVKKLVLGGLLVVLVGILVVGAINRTLDKTSGGHEAQGQGRGSASGNGNGEPITAEWQRFEGIVRSVDDAAATIELADHTAVLVEGRAWAYAQEQTFLTQTGDQVSVTGFYEDGEFKPCTLENITQNRTIVLRDEFGKPMWSGRGRGGA